MSKDDKPTKLEPHLRFPEFKGGPGWDTPAMSDLYGFRSTNSLSRDQLNYDSGSIYNIHYGDIHTKFQTQFRLDSERVPFIDPNVAEELGDRFNLCREGDIILADASEDLNDVGKAIELISLGAHRVVAGTHTIHATRIGDNPVIGFGGYLFKSAAVRRGIHKEAQGAKVYGISSTRIGAIRLPLPHTEAEQRKIAECLGSLDDWIAAETEALAALRRHKIGLMQQLFPRPGEPRPRLRFPEFEDAGDWKKRKAGTLFKQRKEKGTPGLPIYSVTIDSGLIKRSSFDRNFYDIEDAAGNKKVRRGDIAYNMMRMWQGACGFAQEDCLVSPAYVVLKPGNDAHAPFFEYFFKLHGTLQILTAYSRGLTLDRLRLYFEDFVAMPLVVPSPPEQHRIAECLLSLDSLIASQGSKLAELRRHKRGLMQQLFPMAELQPGELP